MFAQVITGKVKDADGLRRQHQKWNDEVRPGADGFVDSTGGVASDGRFVLVARFESPEAARANSDRSEQGAWWNETEQYLDEVQFFDSTDVVTVGEGVTPSAGFVQVMNGRVLDPKAYEEMVATMIDSTADMKEFRPDVLGSLTVRHSGDRYADFIYFTSEAEARQNESKEMPPEIAKTFETMMESSAVDEYVDLTDPWIG